MNKNTKITFPAEWEKQDAIMLSWPHQNTDWAYMLNEVKACFKNIAKAIVENRFNWRRPVAGEFLRNSY